MKSKIEIFVFVMLLINGLSTISYGQQSEKESPLDDIVERKLIKERQVLVMPGIREADIFWEKRIWRIIDVREKMNLPFAYPERPFFEILMDAAINGDITVYSVEDDKFSYKLQREEVANMGASQDTVYVLDPETLETEMKVVINNIAIEDVKRFRVKEVWFFDENTSTMRVRILGIAPLIDAFDDNGNFKYERPLFWVYYPECRELLAREEVFVAGNDAAGLTWDDLFERREFGSYIYKESDVRDRRLEDYLSGVDLLLKSDKIKREIFDFEHDLWSY